MKRKEEEVQVQVRVMWERKKSRKRTAVTDAIAVEMRVSVLPVLLQVSMTMRTWKWTGARMQTVARRYRTYAAAAVTGQLGNHASSYQSLVIIPM